MRSGCACISLISTPPQKPRPSARISRTLTSSRRPDIVGIELIDDCQFIAGRQGRGGQIVSHLQRKSGRRLYLFQGHAWMKGYDSDRVFGAAKVHDTQVGNNQPQVDVIEVGTRQTTSRIIADTGYEIDFAFDKDAWRMGGDEHRIRMMDAVARKTARTQHLYLGFGISAAQTGKVRLPILINLGRRNHRMTPSGPDGSIEKARKWQIAGAMAVSMIARSDGDGILDQKSFAIRHRKFGCMGRHGKAGRKPGDWSDAGRNNFSAVAPCLGTGSDKQFSKCGCTHRIKVLKKSEVAIWPIARRRQLSRNNRPRHHR